MRKRLRCNARTTGDAGAALVTVLLLVTVMSLGAAITFEAVGFSIKRAGTMRDYDQSRQYATGGEALALSVAESLHDSEAVLVEPRAVSFPVDGGRIEGVIRDTSNCFNINSLVSAREVGTYAADAQAGRHYWRLLTSLGLADRQAQELVASLTDWIDSDTRPLPMGAEDYDYANLEEPYRAANSLMTDVSELYMVSGYTPDLMAVLKPFVCAGPTTEPSRLNVNSLTVGQAPLLLALVGGNFTSDMAVELILARPGNGYADVADFWLDPLLAGREIDQSVRRQTSVKAHRFSSRIRVTYYDATSHLTSDIRVDDSGVASVVRHHVGVLP